MLALILAVAVSGLPGHARRTKIAVLDVQDVIGTESGKAKLLTQVLVGELPKHGNFSVLGADEIRSMIGFNRQKQLLGCHEDSCLAEIGGAMGVDYMIVGQLGKLGSRYRFDLRLIDSNKSQVAASEGDFIAGNDDALADAVVKMERKLLDDGGLTALSKVVASGDQAPAGGLSESAPSRASRTGGWIAGGAAVALAGAALAMTFVAKSKFSDDQKCYQSRGSNCAAQYSPNTDSHIADALWGGALVAAGVSTFLFLRPMPTAGAGGEIGISGSF